MFKTTDLLDLIPTFGGGSPAPLPVWAELGAASLTFVPAGACSGLHPHTDVPQHTPQLAH